MGVVFYFVYSLKGPIGISVLVSLLAILTFYLIKLLVESIALKAVNNWYLAPFVPIIALRFPTRPEIISYPLILLILIAFQKSHHNLNWAFLIPLSIILWVNLYGANIIVGLCLLVLLIFYLMFKNEFSIRRPQSLIMGILALSLPLSLLNPNGFKGLFYFMRIQSILASGGEWASIADIIKNAPLELYISYQYKILLYLLFLVLYILTVISSLGILRKISLWGILSLGILLPIVWFRQLPLGILLASPMMVIILNSFKGWWQRLAIGSITIFTLAAFFLLFKASGLPIRLSVSAYPEEVVQFLEKYRLGGRIFNNQRIGAYLYYHLGDRVKVYMDTRDDLYLSTSVFIDYNRVFGSGKNLIPFLEKHAVDIVVGDHLSEGIAYQSLFNSDSWSVVYFSDRYFIAVPLTLAKTRGLNPYEAIDPFTTDFAKSGREAEALAEYRRALAGKNSQEARFFLAQVLLRHYLFQESLELIPQDVKRGFVLEGADPVGESITQLAKAGVEWEANLYLDRCRASRQSLDDLDNLGRNLIFFPVRRTFPNNSGYGLALYFLKCEKNPVKGEKELKQFLENDNLSPLEKLRYERKFRELAGNL